MSDSTSGRRFEVAFSRDGLPSWVTRDADGTTRPITDAEKAQLTVRFDVARMQLTAADLEAAGVVERNPEEILREAQRHIAEIPREELLRQQVREAQRRIAEIPRKELLRQQVREAQRRIADLTHEEVVRDVKNRALTAVRVPFVDQREVERAKQFEAQKAAYEAIVDPDNDEPFPMSFVLERPGFIAWINGENPDYRPTMAEYRLLHPAYLERKRRLKEKALSQSASADVNSTADSTNKSSGKALPRDERNALARDYIAKEASDHRVTAEELAEYIMSKNPAGTCSTSTIDKLPAWRAYQDRLKKIRRQKKEEAAPTAVSLTKKMEAVIGTADGDAELKQLEAESKADREPSPLEADPPDQPPRRVRHRKRV